MIMRNFCVIRRDNKFLHLHLISPINYTYQLILLTHMLLFYWEVEAVLFGLGVIVIWFKLMSYIFLINLAIYPSASAFDYLNRKEHPYYLILRQECLPFHLNYPSEQ